MAIDYKAKFEKTYHFQKSFLEHITADKDYLFENEKHGNLPKKNLQKHLNIYKNNFYSTLIESLRTYLPATAESIPREVFQGLVVKLIKSSQENTITSLSAFSNLFPAHLEELKIHEKIPYITDLARYELLEQSLIKNKTTEVFFKSKHPISELKASLLNSSKLKFKKDSSYHYRLVKTEGFIKATRISKALYLKSKSMEKSL